MPQSFNDTFLGNADVPRSGGQDVTSANATPGGGTDAGGTDSPRITVSTKQAGINSIPGGSKDQSGAQHFNGESV